VENRGRGDGIARRKEKGRGLAKKRLNSGIRWGSRKSEPFHQAHTLNKEQSILGKGTSKKKTNHLSPQKGGLGGRKKERLSKAQRGKGRMNQGRRGDRIRWWGGAGGRMWIGGGGGKTQIEAGASIRGGKKCQKKVEGVNIVN